jgi:hypothetical protein
MKSAHGSALLCLAISLPLAVACGSTDSSGLFTQTAGGSTTGVAGSPSSAGSSAHAGQSSGGNSSTSGGSSGSTNVAGQGTSGSGTAGTGVAGSANGGAAGNGNGGGANGGASSGFGGDMGGTGTAGAGTGGGGAGSGGASSGAGGMSGGGTGGASAGAGGTGGAGCSEQPPQDGVVCTVQTPDNCFYAGEACSCLPDGVSVNGRKWSCYGTPDKCPPAAPDDATTCRTFGGGLCPYSAQDFCVCMAGIQGGGGPADPKWDCNTNPNPVCPAAKPDKNALCTDVKECAYLDRECFCDGTTWTCE